MATPNGQRESLSAEMRRLADNLSRLVRDHLDLAKWELREEAKGMATDAAMGAMALPFLLAALLFLDGALAVGIGSWLGIGWGLLVVGVLNLGIGATLGGLAAARIKARQPALDGTKQELQRNKEMLQIVRSRSPKAKRVEVWLPDREEGRLGGGSPEAQLPHAAEEPP